MGRTLPVRLVRRWLCLAQLGMYSMECQQLWLDALFVNDLGHYWYRTIAQILSPVQVQGNAACLIWSRCAKAMHRKSFGIDRYTWQNPVTMWLCIRVVRFLSDKMGILNRIKLWKIRKNPSRIIACLSTLSCHLSKCAFSSYEMRSAYPMRKRSRSVMIPGKYISKL